MHYCKLMLPLLPPACLDAIVVDEEAEAEAVACTIPSLWTPLLAYLLSHLCHQSLMLALHPLDLVRRCSILRHHHLRPHHCHYWYLFTEVLCRNSEQRCQGG